MADSVVGSETAAIIGVNNNKIPRSMDASAFKDATQRGETSTAWHPGMPQKIPHVFSGPGNREDGIRQRAMIWQYQHQKCALSNARISDVYG